MTGYVKLGSTLVFKQQQCGFVFIVLLWKGAGFFFFFTFVRSRIFSLIQIYLISPYFKSFITRFFECLTFPSIRGKKILCSLQLMNSSTLPNLKRNWFWFQLWGFWSSIFLYIPFKTWNSFWLTCVVGVSCWIQTLGSNRGFSTYYHSVPVPSTVKLEKLKVWSS